MGNRHFKLSGRCNKNKNLKQLEVCKVFKNVDEKIKGGIIFKRLKERGHNDITLQGTRIFMGQDMNGLLDTEFVKRVKVYSLSWKGVSYVKRHAENRRSKGLSL